MKSVPGGWTNALTLRGTLGAVQWARMTRLAAAYVSSHGAATALLVCRRTDCCYHKMMATRVLMLMLVMIAMVTIDVDALATVNDSLCLALFPTAKYCSHGSV